MSMVPPTPTHPLARAHSQTRSSARTFSHSDPDALKRVDRKGLHGRFGRTREQLGQSATSRPTAGSQRKASQLGPSGGLRFSTLLGGG